MESSCSGKSNQNEYFGSKVTSFNALDGGVASPNILPPSPTGDDQVEEQQNKKSLDYDTLYDKIHQFQIENNSRENAGDVQHKYLVPVLRLYQIQAVTWMLHQETNHAIKGGILADEMGLGKTVEVLGVILNHPREKAFSVEWMEPVNTSSTVIQQRDKPDKTPVTKKKKIECGSCISVLASIENVVWRFNSDSEKSSIQRVIDHYCGDIKQDKLVECSCPSLKQRLQNYYVDELAQYSCVKSLYKKEPVDPCIKEPPSILCVCGKTHSGISLVKCDECNKQQHSMCVNYDLKDPYRGKYCCPQCWTKADLIHSKATLIVTPQSISHQWVEEMQRHVQCDDFKVLVYQGVKNEGYQQPLTIAKFDVVITTYDVLRTELYFADAKFNVGEKRSRRTLTYMNAPSPLLSIQFWRLCLDEAQMVEGSTTRAAEMARKLEAIHRWCVTGTPIQKSVLDLHGLFTFLDIETYCDRRAFIDGLETPLKEGNMTPLTQLLAPFFWRTRKSQVIDQVQIPPQTEVVHWLKFSPIEEHFYRQQHEACRSDALARFLKFNNIRLTSQLSTVNHQTLKILLFPLLRLRQACVHPQMVRGHFVALRHVTLTMEELLVTLIKRANLECEESHRLRVAACNGLAALHIIQQQWEKASDYYRDVLRWVTELEGTVKTDTMQRIHTLHNLAELLQMAPKGLVPPTLRDDQLIEEAEQLKKQYLGRALAQVESARALLAPLTSRIAHLKTEVESNCTAVKDIWWTAVFQLAVDRHIDDKLVTEIKEKLSEESSASGVSSQNNTFNNINGLKLLLYSRLEEIEELREKVIRRMRLLEVTSIERLSDDAASCHLRPLQSKKRRERCLICEVHDDIEDYESLLFRMADRKNQQNADQEEADGVDIDDGETPVVLETLRRGTWADSEVERIVKLTLQFGRKHHVPDTIQEGGVLHVKLFEVYKKEFRQLRVVWRQMNDQASAIDELSMATLRLRLRLPHELPEAKASSSKSADKPKEAAPIYLLEAHEVDTQQAKLQGDLIAATNSFKRNMGHALYLKNLEGAGYGKRGAQNPDPCPVCQNHLGTRWSVLLCGHSFCIDCIQLLINQCVGTQNMRCAICRETTLLSDVAYVDTRPESDESDEVPVQVKGSHSTKVGAVVQQLLKIKAKEPDAKCLIFSTWVDVLLIISRALDENGITYRTLFSNAMQKNLNRFKRDPAISVLLVPVQSGANGLNLVEATHVLLVEPILNPGSELQAIGRVHRIGQTKSTTVHRFLVRNTIEEKMTVMLDRHRSNISGRSATSAKENPVTVADLKALFEET